MKKICLLFLLLLFVVPINADNSPIWVQGYGINMYLKFPDFEFAIGKGGRNSVFTAVSGVFEYKLKWLTMGYELGLTRTDKVDIPPAYKGTEKESVVGLKIRSFIGVSFLNNFSLGISLDYYSLNNQEDASISLSFLRFDWFLEWKFNFFNRRVYEKKQIYYMGSSLFIRGMLHSSLDDTNESLNNNLYFGVNFLRIGWDLSMTHSVRPVYSIDKLKIDYKKRVFIIQYSLRNRTGLHHSFTAHINSPYIEKDREETKDGVYIIHFKYKNETGDYPVISSCRVSLEDNYGTVLFKNRKFEIYNINRNPLVAVKLMELGLKGDKYAILLLDYVIPGKTLKKSIKNAMAAVNRINKSRDGSYGKIIRNTKIAGLPAAIRNGLYKKALEKFTRYIINAPVKLDQKIRILKKEKNYALARRRLAFSVEKLNKALNKLSAQLKIELQLKRLIKRKQFSKALDFYRENKKNTAASSFSCKGHRIYDKDRILCLYRGRVSFKTRGEGSFPAKDMKPAGECRWYNRQGRITRKALYREGLLHGQFREWHVNGRLKTKVYYYRGKKTGKYASYYKSGKEKISAYFMDGKLHGSYREKNPTGTKFLLIQFKHGLKHGKYIEWYENGAMKKSYNFRFNKQHGLQKDWDEYGKLTSKTNWENGVQVQ